jgi:hypothetical protein
LCFESYITLANEELNKFEDSFEEIPEELIEKPSGVKESEYEESKDHNDFAVKTWCVIYQKMKNAYPLAFKQFLNKIKLRMFISLELLDDLKAFEELSFWAFVAINFRRHCFHKGKLFPEIHKKISATEDEYKLKTSEFAKLYNMKEC